MTFQIGVNLKANGGVVIVKGDIEQVNFSIIWLLIFKFILKFYIFFLCCLHHLHNAVGFNCMQQRKNKCKI